MRCSLLGRAPQPQTPPTSLGFQHVRCSRKLAEQLEITKRPIHCDIATLMARQVPMSWGRLRHRPQTRHSSSKLPHSRSPAPPRRRAWEDVHERLHAERAGRWSSRSRDRQACSVPRLRDRRAGRAAPGPSIMGSASCRSLLATISEPTLRLRGSPALLRLRGSVHKGESASPGMSRSAREVSRNAFSI